MNRLTLKITILKNIKIRYTQIYIFIIIQNLLIRYL